MELASVGQFGASLSIEIYGSFKNLVQQRFL